MVHEFSDEFFSWFLSDDGFDLREDVNRWGQWRKIPDDAATARLIALFQRFAEFRSLVDYRTKASALGKAFARLHPNMRRATDLYIETAKIGPGLILQHAHSTWILAESIGSDCWINQNVTIGFARGKPTLGNRVKVFTGAVVVGPATM